MAVLHVVVLSALGLVVFGAKLIRRRRFYTNLFPPNTAIATFYTEIAQKYNLTETGLFYLDLWPFGPSQMILVSPEAAELVTAAESYPLHDKVREYLTPLLGKDAIGAADGEKWKELHQMLAPAFRPVKTKGMAGVIAELVRELLCPALHRYAGSGEVFSMERCAAQLVFAISSRVILGEGVSAEENACLLADLNHVVEYATTLALTTATNPLVKVGRWWQKRAAIRRMDSFLQSSVRGCMARIVQRKSNGGAAGSTILDTILVNAQRAQCDPRNPASLKPEFVRVVSDNLKGLLLGGYGTTADTLCYVFIMLALHPTVVQNLRTEHDQVFGSDPETIMDMLQSTPHKLNELHYTTAVIKETLHLFPVGFNARKEKPGSPTLTYKGTAYPTTNQTIIPTIHTIHYDAGVFPHPTKFDPARFLPRSHEAQTQTPPAKAWRPFERGPRACPGRDLAMDELRIILLLTAREFVFECAGVEVEVGRRPAAGVPRALHTDLDLLMGDLAFQEMGFSAKARGGSIMRVRCAA
ncbi:cytochrome P450 [Aspergillus carlsbadensis]|nr:cytochrome P450 [Aspergillus carlsbadensis]